jgi:hypothetical protein
MCTFLQNKICKDFEEKRERRIYIIEVVHS